MAASLSGVYNTQQFTDAGLPASSYRLYTYSYGTTTLKTAYTEPTGTTPHTYTSDGLGGSYIALNARGELPAPLYWTTGSADICLKTQAGATVWTRRADPIGDVGGSALAIDLASTAASKGAALVGYDSANTYAAGTVGAELKNSVALVSAQGLSINRGSAVITPDDLAAALGPTANSTSGAISLPYIGSVSSGDGFVVAFGGSAGSAIQGRVWLGPTVKASGVCGYANGSDKTAFYGVSFDKTNYLAGLFDGPVTIRAGQVLINNTGGDACISTNTATGTAFRGQQNGGGLGALGFYDGTINTAVYGNDNGNAANYAAYFAGKGFVGSAWTVSDARLKRNITDLAPGALATVNAMRIVEYDKLAVPTAEHPDERVLCHEVGFIAQELEPLIPSAVHDDGAWLTVNDRGVLATLVKAVQELSAEVAALRAAP